MKMKNIIVILTQKQSNFTPFLFQKFIIYDCHLFLKKLVDKEFDKRKFDILPKTNGEDISVTCGCKRNYRYLSISIK